MCHELLPVKWVKASSGEQTSVGRDATSQTPHRTLWITVPPATNWSGKPFLYCSCGQGEQTPYHILQLGCPLFEVQRHQTWPEDLDIQTKL
jgi:hypothetical protein